MGNFAKKPSLDDQISHVRHLRSQCVQGLDYMEVMYQEILENLIPVKLWNDHPEWHNVDVEKVIEDLVTLASDEQHPYIQNAEAALGMLKAYKKSPK